MGEIFIGVHELMGNEVVIKVLLPEMSVSEQLTKRFFTEARTAANLNSPGTVSVFDMGYADNGRVYIAMEKLQGEDLKRRLRRVGRLSVEQSTRIVRQLARAVGAAHDKRIIHRDLKPENIFLVPDAEILGGERVKVLDFGLAKLVESRQGSLATRTGAVFGTPAYMAPEQCVDAGAVNHLADLYAIGCVFYECLTGQPPFGRGGIELIAAHLRDVPRSLRHLRSEVPIPLDDIVLQLLAKAPDERIESCAALVHMLERFQHSVSPANRAPRPPNMVPRHASASPRGATALGSRPSAPLTTLPTGPTRERQTRDSNSAPSVTQTAGAMELHGRGSSGTSAIWPVSLVLGLLALGAVALILTIRSSDPESARSLSARDADAALAAQALDAADDIPHYEMADERGDTVASAEPRASADEVKNSVASGGTRDSKIPPRTQRARRPRKRSSRAKKSDRRQVNKKALPRNSREKKRESEAPEPPPESQSPEETVEQKPVEIDKSATPEPPQPPQPSPPQRSYDEFMAEAKDAMLNNEYAKAQRACDQALKVKPRDSDAAALCGIASCNIKQALMARRYQAMVSLRHKGVIRQQCLKAGLTDFL